MWTVEAGQKLGAQGQAVSVSSDVDLNRGRALRDWFLVRFLFAVIFEPAGEPLEVSIGVIDLKRSNSPGWRKKSRSVSSNNSLGRQR
jgi:hypothetical protein